MQALRSDASGVIPLTEVGGDWRDKKRPLVHFGNLPDATVDIAGKQRIYFPGDKGDRVKGVDGSIIIE